MLTAEMYARIKAMMCAGYRNCDRCELRRRGREIMTVSDEPKMAKWCEIFVIRYPAEAVKLVHLWWLEHRSEYVNMEGLKWPISTLTK